MSNSRVAGIYEIRCIKNDMIYIGRSEWIGSRWGYHLCKLLTGSHGNSHLQDDFNKYGVESFTFSVLEIVDNRDSLPDVQIKWTRKYDESKIYNIGFIKSTGNSQERTDEFLDYINRRWLVPCKVQGEVRNTYKIYKKQDKDEIVRKFLNCRISEKSPSSVTFLYIIKYLEYKFGYKIVDGRQKFDGKRYVYKLIVDFVKDKVMCDKT